MDRGTPIVLQERTHGEQKQLDLDSAALILRERLLLRSPGMAIGVHHA